MKPTFTLPITLYVTLGASHHVMAFAPPSTSTALRPIGTSSFVGASMAPMATPRSSSSTSPTVLQMNLFDRFFRVAKSNVNLVLSNLEDPEKIIEQAVVDMQRDLVKVRQAYAEVTANQRRLESKKRQQESTALDWYDRAQLALQKNRDDLARQALTRRQVALEQVEAVQKEINVNGVALDKLYESLQALEQKIFEAKQKKDQILARARTAKTTTQVNDMLSGLTGKTSMDAFKRMEDKVEALEAAAEASAEYAALPWSSSPDISLEKEFLQLESSSAVDEELRQLKGMLQESKAERKNALPSASPMEQNFRVEQELREMKQSSSENKSPRVQWNDSD